MTEERLCPRCRAETGAEARFCGQCGLALGEFDGRELAGRIPHPDPLEPPTGMLPVAAAADLYYTWRPAWGDGGLLLGTEPLIVEVFNAGHALANVTVEVSARDRSGRDVYSLARDLAELPRGGRAEVEIPSYDVPAPVSELSVRFVRADFAPAPS